MGLRAARTQAHEPQGSLDLQSSPNRVDPRGIPVNRIPGFPLSYLVVKIPNLIVMPAKGLKYTTPYGCARVHPLANRNTPRAILSESPGGSGATPDGCARAHPLASQITSRTILSESPGGSGATPDGCACVHPLASQNQPPSDSIRITRGLGGYTRRVRSRAPSGKSNHPRAILSKSPGGSGATVGDQLLGYLKRRS